MKTNISDRLIEFTHSKKLGADILLYFAIERLRDSRDTFWRVDGLWSKSAFNAKLYEGRPSEFVCSTKSFSFSDSNFTEEYDAGLYFASFDITPYKMVAFLFTIDMKVELVSYLVRDPSDADTCWAKRCWSAFFWDDIEKYHANKKPVLKGHRVIGRYMMFPKDAKADDKNPGFKRVIRGSGMSLRLVGEFHNFPGIYYRSLVELISLFSYLGIDLHSRESPVIFLYLTVMRADRLKIAIEQIRGNDAGVFLLISNDPHIDEDLMRTKHTYDLVHALDVGDYARLCFYRLVKLR